MTSVIQWRVKSQNKFLRSSDMNWTKHSSIETKDAEARISELNARYPIMEFRRRPEYAKRRN